jgi:hypothetical protein
MTRKKIHHQHVEFQHFEHLLLPLQQRSTGVVAGLGCGISHPATWRQILCAMTAFGGGVSMPRARSHRGGCGEHGQPGTAVWMAGYCDVPQVLAAHVPDADNPNACAACSHQLERVPWPCIHRICACQARDILRQRLGETPPQPEGRAPPHPRRSVEGQDPLNTAEDQPQL